MSLPMNQFVRFSPLVKKCLLCGGTWHQIYEDKHTCKTLEADRQ